MKLKYFLRGLGAGIIFSAVIMLVAYMTSGSYNLSDAEIISRAEKLGMVMSEEDNNGVVDEDSKATDNGATDSVDTVTSTENITDMAADTTEKATTTEKTDTTEENIDTELVKATITVSSGMGSETVAALMQDAGIISDASDFDSYLNENGYSTQIEIGTYVLTDNMTYQELAETITAGN